MIVQLFTPGLDSFLGFHQLKELYKNESIKRVYFDIKSRYSDHEIHFLKKIYSDDDIEIISNVINISKIEQENAHIPNRNILLLTLAQSFTDCDIIYINGVKDDRVSDNTYEFRKHISSLLSLVAQKDIQIKSILGNYEKATLVNNYAESNNKFDLLENTYSCFNKNLYVEENLPVFEKCDNSNKPYDEYREVGNFNIYGCLECTACYRRMCALTFSNLYVPFYNFNISTEYYNAKLSNVLYPNRIQSIKQYHNFLSWFGCD